MGKSRISLQTFAFGGRNKPMKPYAQLDKNSTNPLWKQIIMKFQLESGISSVSVVLDIKTVDSVGNQLFINQQKSQYLSESPSIEKICASTLQTISDTSHLASLPFVINPSQAKYVVLTPTFSCKSNATESHIITVIINGMAQAVYPIRVYGPRSGQRSRFLKKELEDTCQPTVFVVEASENMEPNGAINSSSGVQAVRLSSSQGLRLNSSAGLPLTYEGMELESLTDAKPNVAAHHITQTNYAPMLDDDDNHYVTPDPCSDINKPWNNSGFGFSGSTNSLKTF